MADSSRHTSAFPELYKLYHSSRYSHILGNTILSQNLLRNPALFIHSNSNQTPQNSSSSSVNPPDRQVNTRQKKPVSLAPISIAKGASHITASTVVAPLERLYMLMQCQNEMLKYGNLSSPYKGITDCFRRTIKHEGVLSLWRGNSVNVINVVTYEASISGLVHLVRHGYLGRVREPPLWMICLSGMLGVLCEYPLLYARTRLGNDVKAARNIQLSLDSSLKSFGSAAGDRKFNGVFDVFKKTFKSDGLIGFYRGYSSACVGFLAYPASGVIESHYRQKETKENKAYQTMTFAAISFLGLPVVTYPSLTVSHRMMMTSGEITKYKGTVDAVRQIIKHEGVSSLYKGFTAYMMYAFFRETILLGFLISGVPYV